MKRLLIVGASGPSALETFYAKAFRRIGVDARQFDPEAVLARVHSYRVVSRLSWNWQHLLVAAETERFFSAAADWDVVLVVKGLFLSAGAIASARQRTPHATWLCFDPDSPFDPGRAASSRHIREAIPLYDTYLIWSRDLLPRLQTAGARRVEYLPFGYDAEQHFPAESLDPELSALVTFVGTYDRQRAEMLDQLADLPIRIYGGGWGKLGRRSRLRRHVVPGALFGADLRRVVSSSLASINLLRPQNAGSHNMRTFEVPAMGGLMLTNRTPEQQMFFPENESSLMYGSIDELRLTIQRLVRGEVDAERIRAGAQSRSRECSYDARARAILELVV